MAGLTLHLKQDVTDLGRQLQLFDLSAFQLPMSVRKQVEQSILTSWLSGLKRFARAPANICQSSKLFLQLRNQCCCEGFAATAEGRPFVSAGFEMFRGRLTGHVYSDSQQPTNYSIILMKGQQLSLSGGGTILKVEKPVLAVCSCLITFVASSANQVSANWCLATKADSGNEILQEAPESWRT